jgi:hypothetical protein
MDLSRVTWRKSSHSTQNGSCVEVGTVCAGSGDPRHVVGVRDSTDREGPALTFTAAAWHEFTGAIRSGTIG